MKNYNQIRETGNRLGFRNGKQFPVYDFVKYYNNIVPETERIICVSPDSYLFDKFYTMGDLITEIKNEIPKATETEITEIFAEIGGNKFDIPSVFAIIIKRLRES